MRTFLIEYKLRFQECVEIIQASTAVAAVRILAARHRVPIKVNSIKIVKVL